MARTETIPLSQRPLDKFLFIPFFLLNITVITYLIDIEQITTFPPVDGKDYPWWPPKPVVDLVRWYGHTYDPLLIARPAFWRATIWWDVLFFGPFYIFAIDAFARGKDWIRVPSIIYATCIVTIVTIILTEEAYGIHASNDIFAVFAANGPWLCVPLALLARMAFAGEKPFSRVVEEGKKEN